MSAPAKMWSREATPYHIPMTGFRHPLREPDVHLSMYPALLLFVHQKFILWFLLKFQLLVALSHW